MKIIRLPRTMQTLAFQWRRQGVSVGFVPTMGALHRGHGALMKRARGQNKVVVLSIFVNPAQFGPREDYHRYPRPWRRDLALAKSAGVDVVFAPSAGGLYTPGHDTWMTVEELSKPLAGLFRPGHFRGVATVVAKLFQLVQPTRAYFGEKDYQQLQIIRRLTKDLHFPIQIVGCPTVRESDGLALSSRNVYLTPAERMSAALIPRALALGANLARVKAKLKKIPGARLEYAALLAPDTLGPLARGWTQARLLVALRLGRTRLIDNRAVVRQTHSNKLK